MFSPEPAFASVTTRNGRHLESVTDRYVPNVGATSPPSAPVGDFPATVVERRTSRLIDFGVQMGFRFKNRTAMTGDLRVQMNRDELSRGNPDDRASRRRAYPERILGSAVNSRRSSSSSAD